MKDVEPGTPGAGAQDASGVAVCTLLPFCIHRHTEMYLHP